MALITCPECGKEISDQAISCPNCGYVMKKEEPIAPIAVVSGETISTSSPPKKYLLKAFLLWLLPVIEIIVAVVLNLDVSFLYGVIAINTVVSGIFIIKIVRAISGGKKGKNKGYRNVIAVILCAGFLFLNGGLLLRESAVTSKEDAEVISACKELRNSLKSPDSLQIHSITAEINHDHHVTYLYIDYSAQNGFGGMNRHTAMYKNGVRFSWMDMTSEDVEIMTSDTTTTREIDTARIVKKLK